MPKPKALDDRVIVGVAWNGVADGCGLDILCVPEARGIKQREAPPLSPWELKGVYLPVFNDGRCWGKARTTRRHFRDGVEGMADVL